MTAPVRCAALLVLSLLMVACGAGGPASVTANDINRAARGQLADGGTLRWPLTKFPSNFNYHELTGPDIQSPWILRALLPSPFTIDTTGTPTVRKEYFESIELTSTEPKQTVTYRINPKAVWYDGTPLTVADFQAQWKALNGSDPAFRVASTQGYDKIESVVAGRDEREVVVTFTTKYADWRALFDMIYPARTNADPTVFNTGWKQRPLTTAGPFKLRGLDPIAKTITLVRNERWWGRPAKLERIIYRVMDADAQVDALANDEIDVIGVGSELNRFQRARAIPGVTVRRAGALDYTHITFNGTSEPLTDLRVRRALAMGIDRGRIAQALIASLGVAPVPLGNHIFLVNQKGYQDNSGDLGEYNPRRAGALLDETGWTLTGGARTKKGRNLTIRFVDLAQVTQVAELVQGMLSKIGVTVTIVAVPANEYFNLISSGHFDLTDFVWSGSPFSISSSQPIYTSSRLDPNSRLGKQRNYARIGSDEIDRLFGEATTELDRTRAIQLANEIDTKIWQEVHTLPLFQRPDIIAAKTSLANFGAFGMAGMIYEDIGFLAKPSS